MKRKKKTQRPVVIAIVSILVALLGLVAYFELRLPSVDERPARQPPVVNRILDANLLIRGCLFDLGLEHGQVEVRGRTFDVRVPQKLPARRLRQSFGALEKYGTVSVPDATQVEITLDGQTWVVRFTCPPARKARLAIIIDDIGLDMKVVRQLAAIDADLTFSIMPQRPYSKAAAKYLHARRREVMLHLPMEGNGKNPGPGAIYKTTSPAEIRSILHHDLKGIPHACGVNNHMGSRVTADRVIMTIVQGELKRKDLFFIDSLTTNKSVCDEVAREIGLRFNARDVFLDNVQSPEYIKGQLDKLIAIARRYPDAIGICHPHPVTITVLQQELPRLAARGIQIEPVSHFVKTPRHTN